MNGIPRPLRWLALAAVFFLALELACRVEDWVRYRTPILSPFRSQGDLIVRDADGVHGRPSSRYQKWVLNSLGMRGPGADSAAPANTLRVVTTGASETFGLYESDGHEYPRQLEDSLDARLRATACGPWRAAQVLNAALPGMALPTVTQDVRLRLARLHPKVVVYYPTPVQYLEDHVPIAGRPDSSGGTGPSPSAALWPRSLDRARSQAKLLLPEVIQTWLRERQTQMSRANRPPGWAITALPERELSAFEQDLRVLVGSVRAIGAEPVLGTHANRFRGAGPRDRASLAMWEKFYPRATGDVIVAFDSAGSAAVARVAADSSVAVADIERALEGRRGDAFADFSHFTDSGAAVVAGTIARAIVKLPDCSDRVTEKHTAFLSAFGL